MAEGQTHEQFRCWVCSVSFDTQRQYLRHFTTKLHGEVEDIQKRSDAMELEIPVEFKVPPQDEATQASSVPDKQSVESPVTSVCDPSDDSASLLNEVDDQEDDGKWFIWLLIYCLHTTYIELCLGNPRLYGRITAAVSTSWRR